MFKNLAKAIFYCCLLLLLVACGPKQGGQPYADVVSSLFDPLNAADLSAPSTRLISTYDRTGGNDDFNHFELSGPDGWKLIADLDGPGVMTRLWMTALKPDQAVRVFVDGERSPRIEFTRAQIMEQRFPLAPPLAAWEQNCFYSYIPVTFQKNLKVMVQDRGYQGRGWPRLFYQVNWTPLSDLPEPFPENLSAADEQALRTMGATPSFVGETSAQTLTVPAGQSASFQPLEGPAVIRELSLTPDIQNDLRGLLLEVRWDGAAEPSVAIPLSDFSAGSFSRTYFETQFLGSTNEAVSLRFPMPFRKRADVSIRNTLGHPVDVALKVDFQALETFPKNLGLFHAQWARSNPDEVGRPFSVLSEQGTGRYLGCLLNVVSQDQSWWILESDESIWRDGEARPSWLGTGLEDYFNGGWYYSRALVRPFHGVLSRAPFQTSQYRLHLSDAVPFEQSIDVQFEKGPELQSKGWMESIAYYYMSEPVAVSAPSVFPSVPQNPLAEHVKMIDLLNHEQLGDLKGAQEMLDLWEGDVWSVRRAAYDALLGKPETLAALTVSNPEAVEQVKLLQKFYADEKAGLLGVFANAVCEVYLDGKPTGTTSHPQKLAVFPVTLSSGTHTLMAKARAVRQTPWVQICLRTHQGDIITSPDWEWSVSPNGPWQTYGETGVKGPPEVPHIKLLPNAFAGMQSQAIGIKPGGWGQEKPAIYLRKTFEVR
jgi:hypothetical protein